MLGAGRINKEDSIDYTVGIILNKKIGDKVNKDDVLAYIHVNNELVIEEAKKRILNAYTITKEKVDVEGYILEII